ncbi:Lrp/AsnC family transcriptional regulator [Paeniglutamicibacter gangotriensis]|uniref:Lrp/AsnC family transcriptional regulator n=3 Tax=Paeniglutamicibacter gangotriensis TaxID=254787 RepID=M7MPC3_9MICC|nr:Lrp/AsnC family transcriptional regulator [Paeniglutamicibacter gangotriensis]EMQ96891.1 Lrp/AsnC family transcriptional regulator [Paeniglutamicibacter gangotriensis Lz1y]KAA0969316.1 Lrp/AsnC family transcriptional regulator [Paeniglutamicibacter gangotriensis]
MLSSESIGNHHQQLNTVRLDDADLIILRELSKDARTPNNLLASRAGIAPSTCLGRVRALQDAGVIRGFHADIDPQLLGLHVSAMISVMVRPDFRHEMLNSARMLQSLPEVQDVFVLGGTPDILIHVICTSVEALRDFVARNLGAKTTFSATQTNLVFEHLSPTA